SSDAELTEEQDGRHLKGVHHAWRETKNPVPVHHACARLGDRCSHRWRPEGTKEGATRRAIFLIGETSGRLLDEESPATLLLLLPLQGEIGSGFATQGECPGLDSSTPSGKSGVRHRCARVETGAMTKLVRSHFPHGASRGAVRGVVLTPVSR